jgi:phosphoribulokinase
MTGKEPPLAPSAGNGQKDDPRRVFVIGIAGDSGSGKTTFSRGIRTLFGGEMVSTITLDDYHTLDRRMRKERGITPLDPRANDFARLERDLADLRQGKTIEKPVYNHQNGTILPAIPFTPKRILILEGLHPFATPALRRSIDFAIYVDPDPGVKRLWKIQRDMEVRGYRREDVVEELAPRARDYELYVAPQKAVADAIIRIAFSRYGEELGPTANVYRVSLLQRPQPRLQGDPRITVDLPSLLSLSERDFSIEFARERINGVSWSMLTLDGELPRNAAQTLQEQVCTSRTEENVIPCHRSSLTSGEIVQLILAWEIFGQLSK